MAEQLQHPGAPLHPLSGIPQMPGTPYAGTAALIHTTLRNPNISGYFPFFQPISKISKHI
ncbi:MAG: hypothetical protein XD82_0482 [Methanoculleus marisnigri]|uniref:Uncharacterized protein n=1 Tax=Methanoculleus marisnigri TaxID=2198 RepID=A0A101GRC7_9EURY|nr:MAG: hypothetical protein XD82_0482 [Methanoculleus marisnigri]